MMPPTWTGLTLAFASALVTNTAYSLEHDAAAALPPLSPRRPFRSVRMLLGDRRWLAAVGGGDAGRGVGGGGVGGGPRGVGAGGGGGGGGGGGVGVAAAGPPP